MKLSVKWLAGLAVLALAIVAVVGSTSATKAATGSIFVANEWSKITNESPAPTGYTARSTVFGTYGPAGGTGRIIETNADLIKVIVKDSGANVPSPTTATGVGEINFNGGGVTIGSTIAAATSITINLVGAGVSAPIAGTLADVIANTKIIGSSSGELNGTFLTITAFFAGSALGDPFINALVNVPIPAQTISSITYNTATIATVEVTIKSELNSTGVTVDATETGIGTGRFEGFVRLEDNTVTAANGTPGNTIGTAALIETNIGPISFEFTDSDAVKRSTTVSIDTSAPVSSITGPLNGSATTNRRPTFSGTVSETGSGLDVSTINLFYDANDDKPNGAAVINTTTGALQSGATSLNLSTSGALDGDTAFSFSKTPDLDIPTVTGDPDNIVDFVVVASDLAGNKGLTDTDPSDSDIDLPTVKIDRTNPDVTSTAADHKTGLAWDGTKEVVAKNSLRLAFIDQLTNVQAADFTVTLDSGQVIAPSAVTVVNKLTDSSNVPFNVDDSNSATFDELLAVISTGTGGAQSLVYLEFANNLVSSETPFVKLQDIVSDLAGNFISQFVVPVNGEADVLDGIAPTLTVTLSGGSGTGTNGEGPTSLTKEKITITIASDEPLSGSPVVGVFRDVGGTPTADSPAPIALGQGSNTWVATYTAPSPANDAKRSVEITSTDVASNSGKTGKQDPAASGAITFTLDTGLATPSLTVGGVTTTPPKTDQTRPSIVIDYKAGGEKSTVTLSKVTLDGTDITSEVVAASDGMRFFYIPPTDLALGDHELVIEDGDAKDAAGNSNAADTTLTITVEERSTFNLDVFAGWNALSFPTDPVDPDINSVFTNAGHDAVLGFDPSVPGQWRVAVRDTVSGLLEPATEGGLTSVRSTQAYWVHSNNFEQVTVLLVGEVLPAAGSPPGIISIPTVLGFNAVPIVDTSRKQATGAAAQLLRQIPGGGTSAVTVSTYLGAVNEGRVYRWNPEILSFELLTGSTAVRTGDVLFVEVLGDAGTGLPSPIFP